MKVFVIDNYDSFVYNLIRYLHIFGCEVITKRNDEFDIEEANEFDKILISPGPGVPKTSGKTLDLIKRYPDKPILGICLGHQAIAEYYGANLTNMKKVYHGVETEIKIIDNDNYIFKNISKTITVGRYHSWLVSNKNLPEKIKVIAETKEGEIMAIKHIDKDHIGLQFHPESIMTLEGKEIIKNWINN